MTAGAVCAGAFASPSQTPPEYPHLCSCLHCQKRAGGPLQSWVGYPLDQLTWTGDGGERTWYDTFAGKTRRGFCRVCGSHLAAFDYGDIIIGINLSDLDEQDDPRLTPVNQSFRGTAVPWLTQIPDTQHDTTG